MVNHLAETSSIVSGPHGFAHKPSYVTKWIILLGKVTYTRDKEKEWKNFIWNCGRIGTL